MTNRSTRNRRGKNISITQRHLISIWCREGWSNRDIQISLIEKFGEEQATSLRVIQNLTKSIKEDEILWNRLQTDGYDAGLILEILSDLNKNTKGKKTAFTQAEAEWVGWVCKAAPNLPAYGVWMISQLYIDEAKQASPQCDQIDLFLGSRCWESFDSIIEYTNTNLRLDSKTNLKRHINLILEVTSKFLPMGYEDENALRDIEIQAASGDPCAIFALALYESTEEKFYDEQHGYQYVIGDDDLRQTRDNEELRQELSNKNRTYLSSETADAVDWVNAEAQAQSQLEHMLQLEDVENETRESKATYSPDETTEIVNSLDS